MRIAHHIAGMFSGWNGRMYVELDDVYSFILCNATIRKLRGGTPSLKGLAIDYLRSVGGDTRKASVKTLFLHEQYPTARHPVGITADDHVAPIEFDRADSDDYITRLALKRCGVVMLDILPARLRRIMLLRYWHGLSQSEAARESKLSSTRMAQLEQQAVKLIRAELARRGIKSLRDVI
jgi:DNA-directed RNA polymerase specialized sigma24 family protein